MISRASAVRLMDQSWHGAQLRAIRRQLFGASAFHRDSDVDRYELPVARPAYAVCSDHSSLRYLVYIPSRSCKLCETQPVLHIAM